jgi:hypothetical protein
MNDEPHIPISSGEDYKEWIEFRKEVEEYKEYLQYSVKEGYIDADEAEEIINKGEWERVKYMMDMSDYLYECETGR